MVALNWIFNGWAKYDNYHLDNEVPAVVAEFLNVPRVDPGIVLEGGAIDVNGAGRVADNRGVPAQRCAGAESGVRPGAA